MLALHPRRSVTLPSHHNRYVAVLVVVAATVGACGSPTSPSQLWVDNPRCPAGPAVRLWETGWPCPPASAIREIDADVKLEFLEDPTAGTFVCHTAEGSADLTGLQERAYQALYLLKRLQFDTPLPWTTKSLWEWFIGNIHTIQFLRTENSHCCGPGGVMYISVEGPGWSNYVPRFDLPNVFGYVHEARHAEKPHTCGCTKDMTISEMGAFGVQYYLYVWMVDHTLAPELTIGDRNYIRWSGEALRGGSAFCTECGGL